MKNVFEEKEKKKKYWEAIPSTERFELVKLFVQVYGGEPDKELEDMVYKALLNGEVSISFLDTARKWVKEGEGVILTAKFEEPSKA